MNNKSLNNKFIRENEIKEITGLSRTTRWRLEQRNEFPRRYKISDGITAYKQSEIMEWINTRELEVSYE